MSVKSQSIKSKKESGKDERLKKISPLRVLLNRPELGALGGAILVFIFFDHFIYYKPVSLAIPQYSIPFANLEIESLLKP